MTTLLTVEEDLELRIGDAPRPPALWHDSAPKAVRKAADKGHEEAVWSAWAEHLRRRKSPRPLEKLLKLKATAAPLLWAVTDGAVREPIAAPTGDNNVGAESLPASGVAARWGWLGVVHNLPQAAQSLDADAWWTLLRGALTAAHDAAREAVGVATLSGQLLRGELPLTLAYLFPELAPCRELLNNAREVLSQGIDELLDGEGVLHAKEWANLRPLLACWTRCRAIGGELETGCWNDDAEAQFPAFVREVIRHARPDGRQLLGPADSGDNTELIAAAVRVANDAPLRRLARRVADPRAIDIKVEQRRFGRASVTSEWAQSALLRPTWAKYSPRLGVSYADKVVQLELTTGRDLVWSGVWDAQIHLNGELTQPITDWEEVCWFSDRDVDYLELEIGLDSGWKMQRKLLLGRNDAILFLADALLGEQPANVEYRGTLPLSAGVKFKPAKQTRDGHLRFGKASALVLPLALPEWRSDPRIGDLSQTELGLELRQAFTGRALFAPLWFDLNPRRNKQPCTWRQLTVAEDREIVSRDQAVGYRVQAGRDQWLIYRSFQQPSNRTLLGHNLPSESLVGRFTKKGKVEPLVEIE